MPIWWSPSLHWTIASATIQWWYFQSNGLLSTVANKDGLISFNSFLSKGKDRPTSLDFAQRALIDDHMMGVLFVMNIDPRHNPAYPLLPSLTWDTTEDEWVCRGRTSVRHITERKERGGYQRTNLSSTWTDETGIGRICGSHCILWEIDRNRRKTGFSQRSEFGYGIQ